MTIETDLDKTIAGMKHKPRYIKMGAVARRALAACVHSHTLPETFRGIPIRSVDAPRGGEVSDQRFPGWHIEGA